MTERMPQYQTNFRLKDLTEGIDSFRQDACCSLDPTKRSQMGQYFTPPSIAHFMASLFENITDDIHLLDAGAGVGTLTAAFVEKVCKREKKPNRITVKAYELEPLLTEYLHSTLFECDQICKKSGIQFHGKILEQDFIRAATDMLWGGLFPTERLSFSHAILNPPYRKIRADSKHRQLLSSIGIETSNLYSAFLALASRLLEPGGELVAITPRSFCNGPYFKSFRELFLESMALRRIHVFDSRKEAFKTDDVLQETIIFHAVRQGKKEEVRISASHGRTMDNMTVRDVDYENIIHPADPELFIHIPKSELDQFVLERMSVFQNSIEELGIEVSTGKVVAFRAKKHLKDAPEVGTVPLIYPLHFYKGFLRWPIPKGRKPNAILKNSNTMSLLLPSGNYVLVKRFTSKEENRRVVAAICDENKVSSPFVGFENHLNVFHQNKEGLPLDVSKGIAVFLNSSLVDSYFRQFNGHTQVNASDLRKIRYPDRGTLKKLGSIVGTSFPTQDEIDELLEREIQKMAKINSNNPIAAKQRIEAAMEILQSLGLPRGQQNERSALTLLALLDLTPEKSWNQARAPLMGITPIMEFCLEHYGKEYAPNTRETFRRQSMHQFIEAGLAVPNPDNPSRPTNSPKFCYQIEPTALELLKTYRSDAWQENLQAYLDQVDTLIQRYAKARKMKKVPLTLAEGKDIYLTPGDHSILVKAIIEEFAPRFIPGGHVVYIGDTGDKWKYFDKKTLKALGGKVDLHGKMPDVIVYDSKNTWLILIEAVTSHGPVNPKRHDELARLFQGVKPGLVYVTAFLNRKDMTKYINDISWETEVWVKEAPTHLIHFDGKRFLGPY